MARVGIKSRAGRERKAIMKVQPEGGQIKIKLTLEGGKMPEYKIVKKPSLW